MCGRYGLYDDPAKIQQYFGTTNELVFDRRFNVAPSQLAPVVRMDEAGNRELAFAQWGLIPSWVKELKEISHPINAKSETAAIKPMFRSAYRKHRVIVPASAFYEWAQQNGKQPYLFRLRDGSPMGLGGLLEYWDGPGTSITSFTILTVPANALLTKYHDRMPAIIKPEEYQLWLDPALSDVPTIQGMTQPYPERLMEAFPISRRVNIPKNDAPDIIEPIQLP